MKVFIKSADYLNPDKVIQEGMDIFPVDYSNKTVLIKPNMLGPYKPEHGATTHPSVVKAVLDYILTKNPKKVYVGDSPGMSGYGHTKAVGEITGILRAAGEHFITFSNDIKRVSVQSRFFSELSVPKILDEIDLIVNVPKFKTHALTYLTGALKNMFGIVVGAEKARIHSLCKSVEEFSEAMIDIFSIFPPVINVMDAIEGMEGNGPNFGGIISIGKIIISDNALAMDTVMAAIMNFNPSKIPLLSIAFERGLGENTVDKIELIGEFQRFKKFKKPLTYNLVDNHFLNFGLNLGRIFFKNASKNHLYLKKDLCIKCGTCKKQCPVDAIVMTPYPVINDKKCISCYCCSELCQYDAWKMAGSLSSKNER